MSTQRAGRKVTRDRAAAIGTLPGGSRELYDAVLAGLRTHQPPDRKSLRGYCRAAGLDPNRARNALMGTSNTAEASKLRRVLIEAARIQKSAA